MATPYSNATTVTTYAVPASDNALASLLDGVRWGTGGTGAAVTLTYSFPTSSSTFSYRYEWSGGSALAADEQQAVRAALAEWSNVANISFVEVADNSNVVGELRFAQSTRVDAENSSAWSYLPDNGTWAGDTWLSPQLFNGGNSLAPGDWNYMTLVHEIGHSLGLKHPFETGTYSSSTLAATEDTYHYTVMSYSATAGNSSAAASVYPTGAMLYDIAAIQYIYGANYGYNSGDTVYTFSGSGEYLEAIWDGGGTDSIVYSSTTGGTIDLRDGAFSSLGQAVSFSGNAGSDSRTVAIAYNAHIENAIGGDGGDLITGNALGNGVYGGGGIDTVSGGDATDWLYGNAGNDRVYGNAGGDILYGGQGNDLIYGGRDNDYISGDRGFDTLYGDTGDDTLAGGAGNDTLNGGTGADQYVFTVSGAGIDVVNGFETGDLLLFQGSAFGLAATGTLTAGSLVSGAAPAAADANDVFLFNTSTGALWVDADGSGAGAAVQVATLAGISSLSSESIHVY